MDNKEQEMADRFVAAMDVAIATRGKRKGFLKAKCPPMGTDAAIFWQEAMLIINPYKASIAQMIFRNEDQQHFGRVCAVAIEYMKQNPSQRSLIQDADRNALEKMGAW